MGVYCQEEKISSWCVFSGGLTPLKRGGKMEILILLTFRGKCMLIEFTSEARKYERLKANMEGSLVSRSRGETLLFET